MPAPPPESDPAIESTRGIRATAQLRTLLRRRARSCPTGARRTRPRSSRRASVARTRGRGQAGLPTQLVEPGATRDEVEHLPLDAGRAAAPAALGTSRAPTPYRRSSTSCGPVTSAAPLRSRPFVPAATSDVTQPGHRRDVAADVRRAVGGDQRARPLRGLDHDRQLPERGHDPVARRKQPPVRPRARRHLGDDRSALADPLVQRAGSCAGTRRPRRSRAPRSCVRRRRGSRGGRSRRCPSASPLTTGTPAAPRPRPSRYATVRPYSDGCREPITTAAGSSSVGDQTRAASRRERCGG